MTEPSPFFRQHHAVVAPVIDESEFRTHWRIDTHVDQLRRDGAITFLEWRAAQIFRSIAEKVLTSNWKTSSLADASVQNKRGFEIVLGVRHDAINTLHDLHLKLGGFAIDMLEVHLIDDIAWTELGRRLGVHAKTARSYTITVLKALGAVMWGRA